MNPKDQTPSSTPDPQWDDIVARLRHEEPGDGPSGPPGQVPDAPVPHEQDSHEQASREQIPNEPVPHEPTAAERAETLRKLFNTGPTVPGPRDHEVQDTPAEFVPPEPPALGSGDPVTTLSWTAAVGGALGLLLCVIFFRGAPTVLYGALALASLVGIVMLLLRLPNHRDPGDDGARV